MIATKEEKTKIPTLEENHIFLFNKDFDAASTGEAIRFILERNLMKKDHPKFIKMIINSPGGEVASCFALIDVMRGSKIPIYTYGLGEISSCGLITFMAGKKGKRFITKNTSILSHQFSSGSYGKEHELHARVTEFNNVSHRVMEHYKLCTGMTEANIKKYLLPSEDVFLTAEEAVKYKLADEIVEFN
jgi:ATP-dependent Clp protease protease subunit